MRAAALLLALLPVAATADAEVEAHAVLPYPPATCAALWEGYADTFGDNGERELATRFRSWSADLTSAAETDTLVAERRPWMRDLLVAYVLDQDKQSRELFERLVTGCGQMAAEIPERAP